jgi:hypothetical protein
MLCALGENVGTTANYPFVICVVRCELCTESDCVAHCRLAAEREHSTVDAVGFARHECAAQPGYIDRNIVGDAPGCGPRGDLAERVPRDVIGYDTGFV